MTIVISENSELKLHVVRFQARVSFNELCELGARHRERQDWAATDTFYIVDEGADLSDLTEGKLDVLRAHYRALHEGLDLFLLRRSVWVCRDAAACRIVEYWLKDRHSRDGQGTDVMLVADLNDATDLFTDEEVSAAQCDAGFVELVRLDDAQRAAGQAA